MSNELEKAMIDSVGREAYMKLLNEAESYKARGYDMIQVLDEDIFFDYADSMGWHLSGGMVLLDTHELREYRIEIMRYEYGPQVGLVTISYN